MGRGPTVRIELRAEEKQTLTMWSKAGTTEQRLAQRARAILASAQGLDLTEVVRQSGRSTEAAQGGVLVRQESGPGV